MSDPVVVEEPESPQPKREETESTPKPPAVRKPRVKKESTPKPWVKKEEPVIQASPPNPMLFADLNGTLKKMVQAERCQRMSNLKIV